MKRILETYPVVSVMLLMFLCLAPVMAMRDFSPANELRYLSIADEALRDGHVFAFTNHGLAYADKPPLYFWIIMLCRLLFGRHSMFVLSLFSFIPAMVMIGVMDAWMRGSKGLFEDRFSAGERAGAALLLGTSGLFLGMSVFLRMDMLMCMWIVLALKAFSDDRPGLFALYTFLALFTKGPVGILAPMLSVLVYLLVSRRSREMGRWFGWKTWAIFATGCLIWFSGVYIDGGKEYLDNLLVHQTVGRAVNSFHHKAPWWFYFTTIWEVLAPWCLAVVPAVIVSFFRPGRGNDESVWAWTAAVTFVMLSLFSSKIAIYLAPIFPFAAYIYPMVARRSGYAGWMKAAFFTASLLLALVGLVLAVAGAFFGPLSGVLALHGIDVSAYAFAGSPLTVLGGLAILVGGALGCMGALKAWHKAVIPSSVGLLVGVFFASWMMPSINDFIGYRNLCKAVPEATDVYSWQVYRPENVDVYLGHEITVLDKETPMEAVLETLPSDAVLMTKASLFPEGLEGRKSVVSGDYAVFLPLE